MNVVFEELVALLREETAPMSPAVIMSEERNHDGNAETDG